MRAGLVGALKAYAAPPAYPPVAMLAAGAMAGRGLRATLPVVDASREVALEALARRERRVLGK
jgi:hypothetical protein